MITLTTAARKRLGSRASAYIEEHATSYGRSHVMCRQTLEVSRAIIRTISRRYGRPHTVAGGEWAYWDIPADDIEAV